jgi:hypothetical protein
MEAYLAKTGLSQTSKLARETGVSRSFKLLAIEIGMKLSKSLWKASRIGEITVKVSSPFRGCFSFRFESCFESGFSKTISALIAFSNPFLNLFSTVQKRSLKFCLDALDAQVAQVAQHNASLNSFGSFFWLV